MIAAFAFQHPSDNLERANVGAEYNLKDYFFVRCGYHINYDADGIGAGFGAAVPTGESTNIVADYSAVDMDALGIVHRVSVRVIF